MPVVCKLDLVLALEKDWNIKSFTYNMRGLLQLPSDFDRAMREASNRRTVTDTDSYAFSYQLFNADERGPDAWRIKMDTILLVVSAICFISAFGIHMYAKYAADNIAAWCAYMNVPWMSAIPWISGFVLAVIPEALLFKLLWVWVFLINLVVVFILGPILARMYLKRFASGKGAGYDIIVAMILGTVTLVIGMALMD